MKLARLAGAAALTVAVATWTGCVLPDDFARVQKDVADIQRELARVRAEQDTAKATLDGLKQQVGAVDAVKRSEFADAKVKIDELSREYALIDDRIAQAERRMDRMAQDVTASRELSRRAATAAASPPMPGGAPPSSLPDPQALYNQAYADFSKGNFPLAESGFEEYAAKFPDSDTADNALYWIGECRFAQESWGKAIEAFDAMLERYPASEKAPAAQLKKGLALQASGQAAKAAVQFKYVVATFPGTDESRIAKERLAALDAKPAPAKPRR